ncbi:MAG: hypothetical protein IKO91_06780 [Oscillospiraceae bacterium]|nr:hypothetical protein [Oscillospiraceae bacterium]
MPKEGRKGTRSGRGSELKCPDCGAVFEPPEGKNVCYCKNCGARLLIDFGMPFVKPEVIVTQHGDTSGRPSPEVEEALEGDKHRDAEERVLRMGGAILFAVVLILVVVLFIVLNRF